MEVRINQHRMLLLPEGAIYWINTQTLLIADAHLGKVTHFRKNGFAVPPQIQFSFYKKMDSLLATHSIHRIFFLGDLFHSARNAEWDRFVKWNQQCSIPAYLVKGNHDILSQDLLAESGLEVVDEWREEGLLLSHHPKEQTGFFNLCGHLHPGVRMQGKGRQRLKIPCFFHRPKQMILPAFGDFTGLFILQPKANDQVYALGEKSVLPISLRKK
jgi:DNA ligase-associated metallophosphoesterase